MVLSKGVQVFISKEKDFQDRFFLSQGVELANEKYMKRSFVPKKPWIIPNKNDLTKIVSHNKNLNPTENVGLIEIPNKLKDVYINLELHKATSQKDMYKRIKNHDKEKVLEANNSLNEFLNSLSPINRSKKIHGFFFQDKLSSTTAYNKQFEFLGLHFDNSTGISTQEIEKAPNRLCINLGEEPRYLLFINKTLGEILKCLGIHNHEHNFSLREIASMFFEKYTDYPVIKVKVDPYEAYIAPTDNLLHDGSLVGKKSPDITLVILGYFNLSLNEEKLVTF